MSEMRARTFEASPPPERSMNHSDHESVDAFEAESSGITRLDNPERRRERRDALLLECDQVRALIDEVSGLKEELQQSILAGHDPRSIQPHEMPYPDLERGLIKEYMDQFDAWYGHIRRKILSHPAVQAFGISVPAELLLVPPVSERTFQQLEDRVEQIQRFFCLHLAELLTYLQGLRAEVEKDGYRISTSHVNDVEKMLGNTCSKIANIRFYEDLVRDKDVPDAPELNAFEQERAEFFQQRGITFALVSNYLEELAVPLRREKTQEAEAVSV